MMRGSSLTNIPSIFSFADPRSPIELETMPIPFIKSKVSKKSKTTRSRPDIANHEHVLDERKRREKIAENLYALSGFVPGLRKRDKASVLTKTIEYMKQLQDKVKALEEKVMAKDIDVEAETANKESMDCLFFSYEGLSAISVPRPSRQQSWEGFLTGWSSLSD